MGTNTRSSAAWPALLDLPPALRECAPWWLATLDRALRERDYCAAAEADRELTRLGWRVSTHRVLVPRYARTEEARHAATS